MKEVKGGMHLRYMRSSILAVVTLLAVIAGSFGSNDIAAADSGSGSGKNGPVNSTFTGTATTGVGSMLPVEVEPWNIRMRSDGAVGLGYKYLARGESKGQVDGTFVYEEHGYLFF